MSLIEAPASEARRSSVGRLLLDPASVALVGVSNDEAKATGRPLAFLRRSGFSGTVYPINPQPVAGAGRAGPGLRCRRCLRSPSTFSS